jgi:hypothetical protein
MYIKDLLRRHPTVGAALLSVIMLAASYLAYSIYTQAHDHDALVPEAGYHYVPPDANSCQDVSPNCGVCYGKMIGEQCYVQRSSPYAVK